MAYNVVRRSWIKNGLKLILDEFRIKLKGILFEEVSRKSLVRRAEPKEV